MNPTFFATPKLWRQWLQKNQAKADELWVGFYKKDSGLPSITWPEAVDQALCFGWIDGLRKGIDERRYTIRFTPRRARSIWSAVNLKRVPELIELGLMKPAGLKAYEARQENRTSVYSYEARPKELPAAYAKPFRANTAAWAFWQARPASYQRAAIWWVVSAKQEATRQKRLATLIGDSANGRTIPALMRRPKPSTDK